MKTKLNHRLLGLTLALALSLVVLPGCGAASQVATLLSAPHVYADTSAAATIETPSQGPSVPVSPANLSAMDGTLEGIYQNASPSVVYIEVLQRQAAQFSQGFPFPQNQNPDETPGEPVQRGSGSGFVWDDEGHIVTNNHVVADAEKIKVSFFDGTTVTATLIGADAASDLAVLQVDVPASQLHPIQLADSTQVNVGEIAIAIGNPFGLESTMTVGIVSALGRSLPVESGTTTGGSYTIPDVIQTDAPINPGNSGGVLLNAEGKIIGVTSAIVSPVRASVGIGFAIPSAIVQKVVPALIETGHFAHPWLGISGTSLNPDLNEAMGLETNQRGTLVVDVMPGSPADEAGLRGCDQPVTIDGQEQLAGGVVIVKMGDKAIATFEDLAAYLARSTETGQTVALTVIRDGQEQQVTVTLRERPDASEASVDTAVEPATADGAWLGIDGLAVTPELAQAMDLPEDQQGILIVNVLKNSPAGRAGLRGSDGSVTIDGTQLPVGGNVITAWNGQSVAQFERLSGLLAQADPGTSVDLSILRDGRSMDITVDLTARPAQ